ncbi:hypothetical protein DKX38_015979 [Salix brachista]|uniref:Uncharacterized protein n=1 Tax=Salix brachista TaxID=2182728 RepID=A0A5N5L8U1_9ROSI|nr:hypothetical protein DKX38_015979 [Salix brachista]
MHGHCAIYLIVAGRSATVNGQASHVLTVAGCSATVGTVAKNFGKRDEKRFPESRGGAAAKAAASGVTSCPSLLNMQLLSMSTVLGVATWKLVLCKKGRCMGNGKANL